MVSAMAVSYTHLDVYKRQAQVYADVTGQDSSSYLSFALAILAVGNIVSVVFAVILNAAGEIVPAITGKGELVRKGKNIEIQKKEEIRVTMDDVAAGIFLTAGFFILSQLVAKKLLPSIFGVAIPNFAYQMCIRDRSYTVYHDYSI